MTTKPSLAQRSGRAATWQLAGGGWQTLVRLGASVFLARALNPEDFGLFGLAMLVQGFVIWTGALGMSAGVMRRRTSVKTTFARASGRWRQFGAQCFSSVGAPLAARFFADQRLTDALRVVSITFLISILEVAVSETLLIRRLDFGALNVIRGCAILLESMVAVFLALYTDLRYWALVYAMLELPFFRSLIFASARWIPKFHFSRESFKYLFRFGINGLGGAVTFYLNQNVDYLFVGRFLGAAQLGLYEFAYRIPHLVYMRVSQPIAAVIFPSLSKMQNSDLQMASAYGKTIKHVALLAFPALFSLAAVADVGVPVLWGEKWTPIIGPLRILCLCAVLRCVPQGVSAVFNCKDRPDLPFKVGLCGLAWTALCVGGLGLKWGIYGVASGMVLSVLPDFYALWLAYRMMRVPLTGLFRSIAPVAVASMASAMAVYISKLIFVSLNVSSINFNLSILIGGVVYPLIICLFLPKLFLEILETFKLLAAGRRPAPCLD